MRYITILLLIALQVFASGVSGQVGGGLTWIHQFSELSGSSFENVFAPALKALIMLEDNYDLSMEASYGRFSPESEPERTSDSLRYTNPEGRLFTGSVGMRREFGDVFISTGITGIYKSGTWDEEHWIQSGGSWRISYTSDFRTSESLFGGYLGAGYTVDVGFISIQSS
ncbi:MAG: hypothetical protein KAQ97_02095, partial [Candidatus Fermentibacteraceae bacterium]|nr:hypothetical protein [Candidatus Fermentibacteraceae bacterium]